jgi:hypothetical protein
MFRRMAIVILICFIACGVWSTAYAVGDNPLSRQFLDDTRKAAQKVQAGQTSLQATDTWGEAEVCAYLRDVAWMVYSALDTYSFDKRDVPLNLQDLVTEGYISFWPLNPLNNWEPMRVLSISDGFSPGDLVVQWAPISHQSIVGKIEDYELKPLSYEVAVYGWTEASKPNGRAKPVEENTWALTPRGIVTMLGTATETATQTLDKIRRRVQRQKEEAQK